MATGYLHLWLFVIFLCSFVLRGDPVTQEFQTTSEDVDTEKVYSAGTQQDSTPNLVSLSHTENIITDNIEASSLVVRPPIAPATPYEDIKVSSSISNGIHANDKLLEHGNSKEQISELEESQSQNLNGGIKPERKDDEIAKEIQEITKKRTKDINENDVDDFDLRAPVRKYESSSSEMATVEGGDIDVNVNEEKIDSKQDVTGQNTDSWENKADQTRESESSKGSISPDDSLTRVPVGVDNEMLDTSAEDSQSLDAYEDLVGTRDDLEGPREDMPSFNEWSQKFLAQEEKKNKEQQNNEKGNSESNTQKKKSDRKQNNYASVDCGAKILEKNNEAQNAETILLENKDLYMLNPCSANIWFIVELCDHVQVTSLQLANFELFSSTIKHLQVSFSTRYPTREWTQLQTLTARSEKSVQTFTLEPIFAKYMKVEQLSYHGSEHYCPWSLLRVYGNSMVEDYEEHESSQNIDSTTIDDDESASSNVKENKQVTKGILKSATDAVLNFVKETAKKLVHSETALNSSSTAGANQTNSTKHPKASPTHEPLNSESPKTIVQLMDREDFEASCHEVADEVNDGDSKKCLPRTVCDSTKYAGHSYQVFLEIIHNICSRDSRDAKACFSNLTKILAVNKSIETPGLKSKPKDSEVTAEKTDTLGKDESVKKATQMEASNTKKHESLEERENLSSSAVVNSVTIATEAETKENLLPVVSRAQRSLTLESVEGQIEQSSSDIPILPLVLPSSSKSDDSSSSSSISTPRMLNKIERPSSPTPLPQPPLAVKLGDPPTEPAITIVNENEGHKGNSAVSSTESSQGSSPTMVVPQVSASQSSVSEHVTSYDVGTVSSENMASVSHERLVVPSLSVNTAPDDRGSLDQGSPGNEGDVMAMKGLNEDKPNPHVDVLKITLTDEETKEGTAELDQTNQDELGVSGILDTENKENVVKDNMKNEAVAPNEPQGLTTSGIHGVKKEENTFGVLNGSQAKENDVLRSETVKENAAAEIARTDDLKKEHEDIAKQEDLPTHDLPAMVEKKHEQLDENDALVVSEATCDKQENEAYEQSPKPAKKKLQIEETSSEGASATDADPGPSLPAGNVQPNGKKESIFVAMSRKIKALEQNVTMTNLFLEELSQRYRKSLEEMQKKLEKKLSKMSKNSKQLSEVNLFQNSTILALTSRLEKLEEELNEATSHLKVVNQEVVERHVLGMCIQFVIVFILWYVFVRKRSPHSIIRRTQETGPKHSPNDSVFCNGKDHVEENGKSKISNGYTRTTNGNVVDDIALDRSFLEEFALPKSSTVDTTPEGKRRRRRRNRSAYGDQFLGNHPANHGQNIVTRSAGLLFHTPGSHDSESTPNITPNTAQRSCSADSLNDIARNNDERKINTKRSAVSPSKAKKVGFRNAGRNGSGKAHSAPHLDDCKFTGGRELNDNTHKGLVRSKSSGDCYEKKLSLYNNDLASCGRNRSSSSRCLLQSAHDYDQLNNQKARWIWGLG